MINLDEVIKVVRHMAVRDIKIETDTPHTVIINHALKQQGVQEVIALLEQINDGNKNLREYMRNIK